MSGDIDCDGCIWYANQKDRNGDVAIEFCGHSDNPNKYEGNCTIYLCPLNGSPQGINDCQCRNEDGTYINECNECPR